ncbi:MAG: nicotinate-nucleotide adenylyltransferase [Motiliproteus sp.]|nr:nicotinate-nucleotide adenylyltransferase [Motiliproteus sp.]MCW9051539.1 nicotinate-nucleotide adenylyltransferase [Motiliproteus sp.]
MVDVVAFMGGTFDPIHNGHLRTALEIRQLLGNDEIRLIPCHVPVHRGLPGSTSEQRLQMAELAVAEEPGLVVDDRELISPQANYSIHTLQSLRSQIGEQTSLCMVMGMDSYLTLPSWHRWQEFLDYAHLLVVQRPGWKFSNGDPMQSWTEQHLVDDIDLIRKRPCGHVLLYQLTPLGISATQVRDLVGANQSPRYLIPDPVWNYIREQGLYRNN